MTIPRAVSSGQADILPHFCGQDIQAQSPCFFSTHVHRKFRNMLQQPALFCLQGRLMQNNAHTPRRRLKLLFDRYKRAQNALKFSRQSPHLGIVHLQNMKFTVAYSIFVLGALVRAKPISNDASSMSMMLGYSTDDLNCISMQRRSRPSRTRSRACWWKGEGD